MNCQEILDHQSLWRACASDAKRTWTTCFTALQDLEAKLQKKMVERRKWSTIYKMGGLALGIIQSSVAGITAMYPFSGIEAVGVQKALGILTFIASMTLWSRLGDKANKHLIVAADLKRTKDLAESVRNTLCEVIADGVITSTETSAIIRCLGAIAKAGESLDNMPGIIQILSQDLADPKSVDDSIKEIGKAVELIRRDSFRVKNQFPGAIHQASDDLLRVQLRSITNVPQHSGIFQATPEFVGPP